MMIRTTVLAASLAALSVVAARAAQPTDPDQRAAATEAQLTDVERFQLLHGIMPIPFPGMPPIPAGLPITAGYVKGIARLNVPDLLETDASLGVANPLGLRAGDSSTAMPSGQALAATFDPALAYEGGTVLGAEARAKGFNVLLGGGVNLARDPRNGRNFEYLGEDPLLAGIMDGEAIRGTQSQGIVSTIKHYALNDQESLRNTVDARIEEAGLRESDLLAFELAIERGQPGSVMCSYNKVNGDYACGNDFLLNQVLKRDWGYKGWVMSDWGAVYDTSFFSKGLDQQSGSQLDKQVWFDAPLQAEVSAGKVAKAQVATAVRRVLRSLYAVGADRPLATSEIDYAAHALVARKAATQGIVLLKNDGILPLDKTLKSILVIGGHADLGVISGGGSSQVFPHVGVAAIIPVGGPGPLGVLSRQLIVGSSPLKALQANYSPLIVDYDSGYDVDIAAASAAKAQVAIVFATRWQLEGWDAGSMTLPQGQNELIAAVAKANPNTIVVLESGNAVSMPWLPNVKAVVEAWYPGEQGGLAIADILTGAANPSGHLPVTFPVNEKQNPRPRVAGLGGVDRTPVTVEYQEGSDVGYRWFARQNLKPQFPFGFGLSYTTFEMSGLKLTGGKSAQATFMVKNTGARAGAAVPQLYLTSAAGSSLLRLAGFSRVELAPGESRSVTLPIDNRLLADWNTTAHKWNLRGGSYTFRLAASAEDPGTTAQTTLQARMLAP
jgi:beta-glucosidase